MSKETPASNALIATPETPVPETPKTQTNWDALTKAGLRPTVVFCQAYADQSGRLLSRVDTSCHSRLIPKAENLITHYKGGHGGEFKIGVRKSDNKPSPMWAELAAAGIEAVDFRCEVCGVPLRFHPTSFIQHLRSHTGKTKQAYIQMTRDIPGSLGMFSFKLGKQVGDSQLEDNDEYSDEDQF
jgi:hypothetical protein